LEALEVAAVAEGFDLVDLEFTGSGKSGLLRVYIDKAEGLTLDEVAGANAWISPVVEELDPYKGSYMLEVSSPGIDRPLRTWAHFVNAVGQEAVITLQSALTPTVNEANEASEGNVEGDGKESGVGNTGSPRLKYTGLITGVDHDKLLITLEAEGLAFQLDYHQIKKAKIKGRLNFE